MLTVVLMGLQALDESLFASVGVCMEIFAGRTFASRGLVREFAPNDFLYVGEGDNHDVVGKRLGLDAAITCRLSYSTLHARFAMHGFMASFRTGFLCEPAAPIDWIATFSSSQFPIVHSLFKI